MTTELTTTTPAPLAVVVEPGALELPALPDQPADRNPALVYLAGLAPGSRPTMRTALGWISGKLLPGCNFASFPWGELRYPHTQLIRSTLADTYSPATANRMLAALRGVLKEAWRLGRMTAEDYYRAVDIKSVRGQKAAQAETGRALSAGEIIALLGACDNDPTPAGTRDTAIVAIAYACGLRRAELAGLLLSDYDADKEALIVRKGKGAKERVIPLTGGAADALADWLHVRGVDAGPLFLAVNKGGRVLPSGLSGTAIYDLLEKRAREAGVKTFTPHDMRRTFAGDLLDAGADIATVQKLMGHTDPKTTAGYDRRGAKAKKEAISKLHVPYRRKWKD